jgi:hypothetical protein
MITHVHTQCYNKVIWCTGKNVLVVFINVSHENLGNTHLYQHSHCEREINL